MASPMSISAPQPGRPQTGGATIPPSPNAAMARAMLLAQEVAVTTIADAERLAAGVLAEVEIEARRVVGRAHPSKSATSSSPMNASQAAIAEVFRQRHEELVALLRECRDGLHALLAASPGDGGDLPAAPAPARSRPEADFAPGPASDHATHPLKAADEEYLVSLYRAIAGDKPKHRPAMYVLPSEQDDVVIPLAGRLSCR